MRPIAWQPVDRGDHLHRCECGAEWWCRREDCYFGDACMRCHDDALTTWLDARQPNLEPEEALLSARKDRDEY